MKRAIIRVIVGAAVLATLPVGLWLATTAPSPSSQSQPPPPSTAEQEAGMAAGQPFADPGDANLPSGAQVTLTLDAVSTRFEVGGRVAVGDSYNGSFVAPTIHLMSGDAVTIRLVNHLTVATNLHFHGLHVSPSNDSDNSFLCAAPGQTLTYHLAIPVNHPIGTFWYHSHAMGTTCSPDTSSPAFTPSHVENQIFAGLSGALIIGDDRALLPADLQHVTAHTLVFKDVQVDGSGHILQNSGTTTINSNNPTVRLVNGQLRPVISVHPGETQLWRLVNAGADIFYQLHLDGGHFTIVDEDGRPVAEVRTVDSLLLPPGKRYDVLVAAPRASGVAWLRTAPYSDGPAGDSYPDVPLAQIQVLGTPQPPIPMPQTVDAAPQDLASAPVAQQRTVTLTENSAGTAFFINGREFSMNAPTFSTPALVNTVEEWTIVNRTGEDHPFHLHTNAFQVMSVNGISQPYSHVQDTVPVPHQVNGKPGAVVVRIAFSDYTGVWLFHCHIAAHEDNGMMGFIDVVADSLPSSARLGSTLFWCHIAHAGLADRS